jgi:hypothetical protein
MRSAGSGSSSISVRTGLPLTTAPRVEAAAAPSKPKAMRRANGLSARLLFSIAASALTSISGLPVSAAVRPAGTQT